MTATISIRNAQAVRRPVLGLGLLLGVLPSAVPAQQASAPTSNRRVITAEAYDRWQTLEGSYARLSPDGQWAVYGISSANRSEVVVRHTRRTTEYRVPGGDWPRLFSPDSRYFVCVVPPQVDSSEHGGPAPSAAPALQVLTLATGAVEVVPGASQVTFLPGKAAVLLYQLPRDGTESPPVSPSGELGRPLVMRTLGTTQERRFSDVTSYAVDFTESWLIYAVASPDGIRDGVYLYSLRHHRTTKLATGPGRYGNFTFDKTGRQVAFLGPAAGPKASGGGSQALYYTRLDRRLPASRLVTRMTLGDSLWAVAEAGLQFTKAENAVLFGVAPATLASTPPRRSRVDSVAPAPDTAHVELWDTRAPYTPPQLRISQEMSGLSALWSTAIYWPDDDRWVRLGTAERPHVTVNADARIGIAVTHAPYTVAANWGALQYDIYMVDTRTGRHTLLRRNTGGGPSASKAEPGLRVFLPRSMRLSPGGKYFLLYEGERWWSYDLGTGKRIDLTGAIGLRRFERNQDTDLRDNGPADLLGWLPDDARVLLHDRFDIWSLDPRGIVAPRNLTAGAVEGTDTLRFRAATYRHEFGPPYLDPAEPLLLRVENLATRATGYWRLRLDRNAPPTRLTMAPAELRIVSTAPDGKGYLLTRESYREFPDLWFTERLDAPAYTRITHAQPQQAEYRWGTAELVRFASTMGEPLAGVLYKPEDFDSTKQYPLVVSVYERQTGWFHHYQAPVPNSANITPVNYVSKGYLVLRPDITYTIGTPCESAVAAVVGAVEALVARGFVDPKRIGLTGHSFGGYETVCILTRTTLFRAAIAGAPAVNLISSYGTYSRDGSSWTEWTEVGQARMGTTPWESPAVYLENSPIFHVQHIQTPLLLMHNDGDDNLPWFHSLELFTALRRLGKEAYLFTYPGEGHGIRRRANQLDWDRRSQAFFDYYLMDGSRPSWMGEEPAPRAEASR